jgi:hypothetical protein
VERPLSAPQIDENGESHALSRLFVACGRTTGTSDKCTKSLIISKISRLGGRMLRVLVRSFTIGYIKMNGSDGRANNTDMIGII